LIKAFGLQPPDWHTMLKACIQDIRPG